MGIKEREDEEGMEEEDGVRGKKQDERMMEGRKIREVSPQTQTTCCLGHSDTFSYDSYENTLIYYALTRM